MKKILVVGVSMLLASGCAVNSLWSKPGSTQETFNADSKQCKAEATGVEEVRSLQIQTRYIACMEKLGWQREKSQIRTPPPAGS